MQNMGVGDIGVLQNLLPEAAKYNGFLAEIVFQFDAHEILQYPDSDGWGIRIYDTPGFQVEVYMASEAGYMTIRTDQIRPLADPDAENITTSTSKGVPA